MLGYVLRRVLAVIPVLIVVALFTFTILRLMPGDPAAVIGGDTATPEEIEIIRKSMGLDKPIYVQLGIWLADIARGDLGESVHSRHSVAGLILSRVEPTLSLAILTEIIAISIAVPLGVLAAWKANSIIDRSVMLLAVVGFSMPVFWLGFMLMWLFGIKLEWLPVATYVPFREDFFAFLQHLILPSVTLGLVFIALIARMTRATVLEVLREDYIRTARAKGLADTAVLLRHAMKNAALPIVTIIGLGIAGLISGVVVTETIFAIPGIGRLSVDAIVHRDYPVIQGVILMTAGAYVFINLAVDITYAYFDPRIRY